MKKLLFLVIISLFCGYAFSQDFCDFYKARKITWYGIDYSRVKLVGPGFNDVEAIKGNYFSSWNNLILTEPDKYDLEKYFGKDSVDIQIEEVTGINQSVNTEDLVTLDYKKPNLSNEDIAQIIRQYKFKKADGYGILMIADKLIKTEEMGYYNCTIIDLRSKSIIKSIPVKGKAGGIGFRNYWAKTINGALKECKDEIEANGKNCK